MAKIDILILKKKLSCGAYSLDKELAVTKDY